MAQPAQGTAIPASTTIDALCTTLFATRSSDLGSATYTWGVNGTNSIVATFPASTTPNSPCLIYIGFQPREVFPSIIQQ
jgi:hypothetical protein